MIQKNILAVLFSISFPGFLFGMKQDCFIEHADKNQKVTSNDSSKSLEDLSDIQEAIELMGDVIRIVVCERNLYGGRTLSQLAEEGNLEELDSFPISNTSHFEICESLRNTSATGNVCVFKKLLSFLNKDDQYELCEDALPIAASAEKLEMVEFLLQVSLRNAYTKTCALEQAVIKANKEIIELLLKNGISEFGRKQALKVTSRTDIISLLNN